MRRLQVTRPLNASARDARSAGGSATPVRATGGGGGDSEGGVIGAIALRGYKTLLLLAFR